MQMLEIKAEPRLPLLFMTEGATLHVVGHCVDEKTMKAIEPVTAEFPILFWAFDEENRVAHPALGRPIHAMIARFAEDENAIFMAYAIRRSPEGMVYSYDLYDGFSGAAFATVAEWEADIGMEPQNGLSDTEWKKAVKEFRSEPQFAERKMAQTKAIVVPPVQPAPMSPPPLPTQAPVKPIVPAAESIETPAEIEDARRNMQAMREAGMIVSGPVDAPTGVPPAEQPEGVAIMTPDAKAEMIAQQKAADEAAFADLDASNLV